MERDSLKILIGWGLIILSVFVVFGTLRGKHGVGPLFPQMMPVFGSVFALFLLAGEIGLGVWCRSKAAVVWVAVMFFVGVAAGGIGEARWEAKPKPPPQLEKVINEFRFGTPEYDWTRHKLISGVALAGLVLGFQFARGKY